MNKIIVILFVVFFGINLQAQDIHFTQFYANPVYLAPSFAGGASSPRIILNFRDQWTKIPGNYLTFSFSADQYFSSFNSGIGVYFLSDNAGSGKLVTNQAAIAYSYKVNVTRDFIFQPGLSAYYFGRSIDESAISFADEYFGKQYIGSSSEVLPDLKVQHVDFAVSVLGYYKDYWFGVNVDHLMNISPELRADYRYIDMKVSVFGGMKYRLSKRIRDPKDEFFHIAFNYFYQAKAHQLDIGLYYNRLPIIIGLWYRGIPIGNEYYSADALIYLAGFKYKNYTISYSYDMTIGKLISRTGGSHEISIMYRFKNRIGLRGKKYKAIPCPEF